MVEKHRILIIGGGSAGITVAARLLRAHNDLDVAIVEPSMKHYYQPLWTLVGGGVVEAEDTEKPEEEVIPHGATWIQDRVVSFDPDGRTVELGSGKRIAYDYLIVAPGIKILWDAIDGLRGALGKDGVCSNYSFDTAPKTWEFLQAFQGGDAIFTVPQGSFKCGGAPQKIMWLAQHYLEKQGLADKSHIVFASAGPRIFGVEKYRTALEHLVEERHIDTRFNHQLIAVRPASKEAIFRKTDTGDEVSMHYDLLHVVPPMSAPDCVTQSPLASAEGWVDVDKYTMQHVRYPEVFSLGDASSLPTAKTGAAVRKQAPILVENLLACMEGRPLTGKYNGYTSCPIVTGYGRLILAEFDYDGNPVESFPIDQSKERLSMYLLKKHLLPPLYWKGMLRGRV